MSKNLYIDAKIQNLNFGDIEYNEIIVNIKPKKYEFSLVGSSEKNGNTNLQRVYRYIFESVTEHYGNHKYKLPTFSNKLHMASITVDEFIIKTNSALLCKLCNMRVNENCEKNSEKYCLTLKKSDAFVMKSPTLMLEYFGEIYLIPELVFGTYKGVPKKMTYCSNEIKLKNQTRFFYMEDPETDLECIDVLVTE